MTHPKLVGDHEFQQQSYMGSMVSYCCTAAMAGPMGSGWAVNSRGTKQICVGLRLRFSMTVQVSFEPCRAAVMRMRRWHIRITLACLFLLTAGVGNGRMRLTGGHMAVLLMLPCIFIPYMCAPGLT